MADPLDGSALAVELKYLTDSWEGQVGGESFRLLRQAAQDIRAYDSVKDIERVERLVAEGYATAGLVLVLANDPSYWRSPDHGRPTNADAFRLHGGRLLAGSRVWGPLTGAGTSKGRTEEVNLVGQYTLRWQDYSVLNGSRGRFRFLAVIVS